MGLQPQPLDSREVQLEEYRSLRAELAENRKLIFARPLLIVAGALGGKFAAGDSVTGELYVPILLVALFFNLWFMKNRLHSNGRIVAYLQLVHETREYLWIGWETALRRYRFWWTPVDDPSLEEQRKTEDKKLWSEAQVAGRTNNTVYYRSFYLFHIWAGVLTATLMIVDGGTSITTDLHLLLYGCLLLVNVSVVGMYVRKVRAEFHPDEVAPILEFYMRSWRPVLSHNQSSRGT